MHRVAIARDAQPIVVVASGELDAFAAADLAAAFEETQHDSTKVVVDLRRAAFIDSTILGLVVRAVRELSEAGAEARIVLPQGSARRIFEITGLDKVLPVADTLESALEELAT